MKFGQYLIQNIRSFCLSIAVPILFLGAFSFILTTNYISTQLEDNNLNMIQQVQQTLDNTLLDVRSLDITLSTIPSFAAYLKAILHDPQEQMNADMQINFRLLTGLLVNKTAVNLITHSICIYYPNPGNNFFTSMGTISDPETYYDSAWFEPCLELSQKKNVSAMWLAPHEIGQYAYDTTQVVTYLQRMSVGQGVLVCNFNIRQINALLSSTSRLDSQCILVTDSFNRPLFACDHSSQLSDEAIAAITSHDFSRGSSAIDVSSNRYYVSLSRSEVFDLNYYSIVESSDLYRLPNSLIKVMILLLVFCFIIMLFVAYRNAVRSRGYIDSLLFAFEAASRGESLPSIPQNLNDRTITTITTIIENFLKTDLLQVQLSEKMYQNRVLELTSLQSQMNPHFLYNTLDTLYWRIIGLTHGPSEETKMIEDLADLLRYALQSADADVRLSQEIENAKAYVDLQSVRFGHAFSVVWDIAPEAQRARVLKLILQPLIENCIQHALIKGKPLTIVIAAEAQDGLLRVSCTDDGMGIEAQALDEIQRKLKANTTFDDHIGVFNTDKRIRLAYGEKYGLSISSEYTLGTRVVLTMPYTVAAADQMGETQ